MEVSEETLTKLVNDIKSSQNQLSPSMQELYTINNLIEMVDSINEVWNTEGSKLRQSKINSTITELESTATSTISKINLLINSQANYTKTTVTKTKGNGS